MREDYVIQGKTARLSVDVEGPIVEQLEAMSQYTSISPSEIVNTAMKRFISQHKDFFPPDYFKDSKSGRPN